MNHFDLQVVHNVLLQHGKAVYNPDTKRTEWIFEGDLADVATEIMMRLDVSQDTKDQVELDLQEASA